MFVLVWIPQDLLSTLKKKKKMVLTDIIYIMSPFNEMTYLVPVERPSCLCLYCNKEKIIDVLWIRYKTPSKTITVNSTKMKQQK